MARAVLGAVDTLAIRLPPGGTPQSHQAFFFSPFFPPVFVFFIFYFFLPVQSKLALDCKASWLCRKRKQK